MTITDSSSFDTIEQLNNNLIESVKKILKIRKSEISSDTLEQYIHTFELFKDFLKNRHLTSVTNRTVNDFLEYLKRDKEYKGSTLALKVAALRKLYDILEKEKRITENPMLEIKTPKSDSTPRISPTRKEVYKLIKEVKKRNLTTKERDIAVIYIIISTGATLKQVHNLDIADIKTEEKMVVLDSKKGTSKQVSITSEVLDAINAYLRIRHRTKVEDKDALFISKMKRRLSTHTIQKRITKYLEWTDIKRHIMVDGLRKFKKKYDALREESEYPLRNDPDKLDREEEEEKPSHKQPAKPPMRFRQTGLDNY